MLSVIANGKLLRILLIAAIQTVLFGIFTYHVEELTLFPKPGTAPKEELYQNISEEALSNNQLAIQVKL